MVGLKSVWPLFICMLLFAACVPQSKQTECGSNEAFNSQLRTCVPIVQGPSSFINISSFDPLYTATRYKSSTLPVQFKIVKVSNPYGQAYTIQWAHSFNASEPDSINPDASAPDYVSQITVYPSDYSSQVGSHSFTALVKNSSGTTVDSHSFELKIVDSPKPTMLSFVPSSYSVVTDPVNTGYTFSFSSNNNGATSIGNYRVRWVLSKNGTDLGAPWLETDSPVSTATNGTNTYYYGTSTVAKFDPSNASLGVGSYVLRATLVDTGVVPEEVVGERQWTIEVKYPDFGFVSSANTPLPSQDSIAFHGVNYRSFGFTNALLTKSQYCVKVSQPQGSYVDGSTQDPTSQNIVVRYYKDPSGSPIYEGVTTAADDTICFSDASNAEQDQLFFSDGSATVAHYKSLTARVFDEQTGREMCQSNMPTCSAVTYPISWPVLVKPVNQPATAAFVAAQAGDNITYTSSGATSRGATVVQDDVVKVRFTVSDGIAGLEGYDMTATDAGANFKFTMQLKKGATIVSETICKDFATANFPRIAVGSSTMNCTFTVPSFDSVTGLHNPPAAYTAYLLIEDTGSPAAPTSGIVAQALTLNLNVIEKKNAPTLTAPVDFLDTLSAVIVPPANEGDSIRFRVQVADAEHNTYNLQIEHCGTDATCASSSRTLVGTDTRIYGDPLYSTNTSITYSLKEDEIGAAVSGNVYFRVVVADAPVTTALSDSVTSIVSLNLNNFNKLPDIDMLQATPAVNNATAYEVFTGFQFTAVTAPAIIDTSIPVTEQIQAYQWWIGTVNNPASSVGWVALEGQTQSQLRWTPGPELSGTYYITVCYSDGYPRTTANSSNPPGTAGLLCSADTFKITPRTNLVTLSTPTAPNGEVALFPVPSENLIYMAYADDDVIYVEKVLYASTGVFSRPMRVASFNALSSGTAQNVKNLSIAASTTSLYVSYLADSATTPNSFRARIRRINISNDVSQGGGKTDPSFSASTRKFDFNYSGITVTPSCSAGTNCQWNAATRTMTFDGTLLNAGDTISITVGARPAVVLTMSDSGAFVPGTICYDCSANEQAQSFADAINLSADTNIQGLTGYNAALSNTAVIYGVENNSTAIYDSTQTMSTMGKILVNPNTSRWYVPVANADLLGNQNKIQILHGADGTLTSPDVSNVLSGLAAVSSIDNAWSSDATAKMFIGYIELSGSAGKIARVAKSGGDNFDTVDASVRIVPTTSLTRLQIAGPIGTFNPNVFATSKDVAGNFWVTRAPVALSTQNSYDVSTISDTTDTTILTDANITQISVQPARPLSPAVTTNEGRLVVVSNNGTIDYKSYLFRWKTSGGAQVLDATTDFDTDSIGVDASSKIATFAPTSFTFGSGGSVALGNTNSTMGVLRLRDDGEVEAALLNTEIESINSTTNSATGEYRAPLVK